MGTSSVIQVRIDNETRQEVDKLFSSLGFSTQTAIKMFFSRSLEHGGIPFDVAHEITYSKLNQETLDAITELDEMRERGEYGIPASEFFAEMRSWI
jgi:addiction module RelB/DinJ family antitoxin